jgi:threonine/homoserine/homoserine lactone efflux protein
VGQAGQHAPAAAAIRTRPVGHVPVFLGLLFTLMGLTSDGLYAIAAGVAGRWVKPNSHHLRWERFITGGLFIGVGVTAFAGNRGR